MKSYPSKMMQQHAGSLKCITY